MSMSKEVNNKEINNTEEAFNVDEALTRLEEINNQLSQKDIALNDSITLYKEGVLLAAKCQEHLVGVEKQLEIINA